MNQYLKASLRILGIVFGIILFATLLMLFLRPSDARLDDAYMSYLEGESAQMLDVRKKAFNKALDIYLKLDKEYQPRYGNGKLYYNIGNTFFQLEQYPWSVLYYEKTHYLQPRDEKVLRNLMRVQDKLQLTRVASRGVFDKVFFFHTYLSLPERLQLFCLFSLAAILFSSAFIWKRSRWSKNGLVISVSMLVVMLMSLGYSRYLAPVEGVLVKTIDLRRDAGEQYAKVGKQPIQGGTKVEVLSSAPDGAWLKVLTPNGELGYVSQEAIRMIGT